MCSVRFSQQTAVVPLNINRLIFATDCFTDPSHLGERPTTNKTPTSWLQPESDHESRRDSTPRRTDWLNDCQLQSHSWLYLTFWTRLKLIQMFIGPLCAQLQERRHMTKNTFGCRGTQYRHLSRQFIRLAVRPWGMGCLRRLGLSCDVNCI
jgi:hypothetical protein